MRAISHRNWVVQRSVAAKTFENVVTKANLNYGKTLIFENGPTYSSEEMYVTLGTGKGTDFLFKDKAFKSCFVFYQDCAKNGSDFYEVKI